MARKEYTATRADSLRLLIEEVKITENIDSAKLAKRLGISDRTLSRYRNEGASETPARVIWLLEKMAGHAL
jgi:transcriptional regulator with XRE-family HTH domain